MSNRYTRHPVNTSVLLVDPEAIRAFKEKKSVEQELESLKAEINSLKREVHTIKAFLNTQTSD